MLHPSLCSSFPPRRQRAVARLACVSPTMRAVVAAAREPYRVHQPALPDLPIRPPQKFHLTLSPGDFAAYYGTWASELRYLPSGASVRLLPGRYPPLASLPRNVNIFGSGPETIIGSSSRSHGVAMASTAPALQLFLADLTVEGKTALNVEGGSLRVQARGELSSFGLLVDSQTLTAGLKHAPLPGGSRDFQPTTQTQIALDHTNSGRARRELSAHRGVALDH